MIINNSATEIEARARLFSTLITKSVVYVAGHRPSHRVTAASTDDRSEHGVALTIL